MNDEQPLVPPQRELFKGGSLRLQDDESEPTQRDKPEDHPVEPDNQPEEEEPGE